MESGGTGCGRNDRAKLRQATGMTLVQLGVPAQETLVLLRSCRPPPVAEVARDMAARRLVFIADMDSAVPDPAPHWSGVRSRFGHSITTNSREDST